MKQILDGIGFENRIRNVETRRCCLLWKIKVAKTTGVSRARALSYAKNSRPATSNVDNSNSGRNACSVDATKSTAL